MEAVSTRARFADFAPETEARQITATVSRGEIEKAARAKRGEPELLLDVRLSGGDGQPRVETRRMAVAWERADLKRLLKEARGDTVTLAIDLESLVRALEGAEVEAHGLRETAAVLTVALATAAGASAAVDQFGGPSAGVQTIPAGYSAVEETREAPPAAPETIPAGYSAVEETREAPPAAPGGIPVSFSTVEEIRGKGTGAPETAPGGGVTISAPSLAEALGIAGALTLAIAGAAFAVRARRREKPA